MECLDRLEYLDRLECLYRLVCLDILEFLDRLECLDWLDLLYWLVVSNKSNIYIVGGGWVYLDYSVSSGPFLRFPMSFEFLSEMFDHSVSEIRDPSLTIFSRSSNLFFWNLCYTIFYWVHRLWNIGIILLNCWTSIIVLSFFISVLSYIFHGFVIKASKYIISPLL